MPGLNKTGPEGNGPMTGRQMGRCSGATSYDGFCGHGFMHHTSGLGRGGRRHTAGVAMGRRGYAMGGFRYNQKFNASQSEYSPEEEKQFLKEQKEFLEKQINGIDEQLKEM